LKRILIINPFGIGDVLFTTPVIRALKENLPDSFICYWTNERVRYLLEHNPQIDKIFGLSRGDIKKICSKSRLRGFGALCGLLRNLRKEGFDIAIDFSLDHRYGLISRLIGIKKRIGFDYKNRGRFLTDKIRIDGYADRHVVEYNLDLLGLLNLTPPASRNLELIVSDEEKEKARELLFKAGIYERDLKIGIAPGAGASWGRDAVLKHWPPKNFAYLADKLIEEFNSKIVILGDAIEKSIAEEINGAMAHKAIDLTGATDLRELAAIISCLDILVANDGGPLHMAVALGIKTVSIFGPVDPVVYGPYPVSPKHIVLKKDLSCRPCYKKFKTPVCLRDKECIKSITISDVFDAVRRLL